MPRESNFPAHIAVRVTNEAATKVDEAAERLRVDRAQVVRWWLDEMPAGYVPEQFKSSSSSKGKKVRP